MLKQLKVKIYKSRKELLFMVDTLNNEGAKYYGPESLTTSSNGPWVIRAQFNGDRVVLHTDGSFRKEAGK